MVANRLKLNDDKTELTICCSPFVSIFLARPPITISSTSILLQSSWCDLAANFGQNLTMSIHVNSVWKYSYFHLRRIYSTRPFLDVKTAETIIHAFVTSRMYYCNSLLFGITKQNFFKFQKVQNCSARICLNISRKSKVSYISLLRNLHWLPIQIRINFKILLFVFKCIYGLAQSYFRPC